MLITTRRGRANRMRRSLALTAVSLLAVLGLSGCSLIPASWTAAFGSAIEATAYFDDVSGLYEGNDGIAQDLLKSYLLYRMGVEKGVAKAAFELGLFVAWEDYEGFWHDPVKGYGYCLLGLDWGHSLEEGDAAADCEEIAEGFDETRRATARAFAESLKAR